jgi:hypothetical protein
VDIYTQEIIKLEYEVLKKVGVKKEKVGD